MVPQLGHLLLDGESVEPQLLQKRLPEKLLLLLLPLMLPVFDDPDPYDGVDLLNGLENDVGSEGAPSEPPVLPPLLLKLGDGPFPKNVLTGGVKR